MIDIYNNDTNELVGSITDADLRVLVDRRSPTVRLVCASPAICAWPSGDGRLQLRREAAGAILCPCARQLYSPPPPSH
jgi:hypothetical protein